MTIQKQCLLTTTSTGDLKLNKEFDSVSKMTKWIEDQPWMYTDTIEISFKMLSQEKQ